MTAPGDPFALGAHVRADGAGVNFSVSSHVADSVTLCLFDSAEPGAGTEQRVELDDYDAGVWHGFIPGLSAGQAYGYRVAGPWDPAAGLRCNPGKLLLDPYARAFHGDVRFGPEVAGHDLADPAKPSALDSAAFVPRSLVTDGRDYDWAGDEPPRHSYADTIIYEAHAKGLTARHPDVPPELRGTYAGLAHEAVTGYLRDLGVTAVELLPVHHFVPEQFLLDRGLTNYWGYNSVGFFAPHAGYSAAVRAGQPGGQVGEFRDMVRALHRAGLEVILDVVFNHTAEGGWGGPTLSFRGLDNAAYYRLADSDRSQYYDTTGTGNSLNADSTVALRLIMDSLRYWISEMHVDGFRFDLATTLGREDGKFDQFASFFDLVAQDPVISRAKLIAEPWDVGQLDSYDLGRFPAQWREWNGKYRDSMRDFWRSAGGGVAEFATRFTGSSDLYGGARRRPTASVNLITVHDGFTLLDLVSYDGKHNEANGESNRDGSTDNRSWNCGAEGPSADPAVRALRARQQRAMLTTLLLSFGLPLLLGGDEIGRTQGGNNNAYCQDNEISWFDWSPGAVDGDLLEYVKRVVRLRRSHPAFRRQRFLTGAQASEVGWYTPAGTPMDDVAWADDQARCLAIYLDGRDAPDEAADGTPLVDDDFLVLVNAWWEEVSFTVPETRSQAQEWHPELDSFDPAAPAGAPVRTVGDQVPVRPRSVVLLRSPRA
ncbi:MAG TPA: glycogen debranching protein GlgX [Trebonia sp.]|jgi:glycogen operon protein|nr:glycogen debranching protein GlgX [Trebonia sp.]